MSDIKIVMPTTQEEWQRDCQIAYEKGRAEAIKELPTMLYYDGFNDGYPKGKADAIEEFANWLVEQGILGNRCIADGEITDYGKVYSKKYKVQLKEQNNE